MSQATKSSRVDEEAFQANTDSVAQDDSPSVSVFLVDSKICSTEPQHQRAINDFLIYTRNLNQALGRHWDLEAVKSTPLEEDELVIEYLSRFEYDTNIAKFNYLSELGIGQDVANIKREVKRDKFDQISFAKHKHQLFVASLPLLGTMKTSTEYEEASSTVDAEVAFDESDPALKKKWVAVTKRVHGFAQKCNRSSDRPSLLEAQTALEEAALLPEPSVFLSEDTVSSYESSLNALLGSLLSAREWVAELHDQLGNPLKLAIEKDLKALLSELETLPLTASAEEAHLRRVLREAEAVRSEAEDVLHDDQPHRASKISVEAVEALVSRAQLLRVRIDAVSRLEAACAESRSLSHRALVILEASQLLKASSKKNKQSEPKPPFKLGDVESLLKECDASKLDVAFAVEVRAILSAVSSWREEVGVIERDDGKVIALQRIEQLLVEAEGFPFDLSSEMEVLRGKKDQARGWLDKLKKVFPGKNRQLSRKQSEQVGDEATGGKLNLNDMKELVAHGELLLQRGGDGEEKARRDVAQSSRELNKAQTLVEAAEEWVVRVRELLAENDPESIEALEDLLSEADDMPVYMEEMTLLRVHLNTLEWSVKAKKKLDQGKPRQADVAKLMKDLAKIRSVLPDKANTSLLMTFPEEAICSEALGAADKWTARCKRLMLGAARRDISYSKLRDLYADALASPVNLEVEIRPIYQAITDAEVWVKENMSIFGDVGITTTLKLSEPVDATPRSVENAMERSEAEPTETDDGETALVSVKEKKDISNSAVELIELEHLNQSASHLIVVFPELTELRERIASVNSWIEDINSLCPRRLMPSSKRKGLNRARRMDEEELDELLERGSRLGVNVSGDLDRVSDVIHSSKKYNLTCLASLDAISTQLSGVEQVCLAVVRDRYKYFPFLQGVKDSSFANAADHGLGNALNSLVASMSDLVRQGEESVLFSPAAARVDLCAGTLRWVVAARKLLHAPVWPTCNRDEVDSMIADAKSALDPEWCEAFAQTLADCGFDDDVALSDFLAEVPEMDTNNGEEEQESQRRSQRKRVERQDLDEEAPAPRRRKNKDKGTPTPTPEEPIVEEKVKKRKRGDKSDKGVDAAVESSQEVKEVEEVKPVLPPQYEPVVGPLVANCEDLVQDEHVEPFLRFLYLWVRMLELLQRRLCEADAWSHFWNSLKERVRSNEFNTQDARNAYDEEVSRLTDWSKKRVIRSTSVEEMLENFRQLVTWTKEADGVESRENLLTVEDLRDLIKKGEGFNVYLAQLESLKSVSQRAKSWVAKFQRMTVGGRTPKSDEVDSLAAEAELLPLNLDEYTNVVNLDSKKYCICRQGYHAEMIGCDECDEWYHFQCVGLTPAQADKMDKYLCIRCTLRLSFHNAAMLAAQSVNKWMVPSEIMRSREQRLSKVSKRVNKEERDVQQKQAEVNRLLKLAKDRYEEVVDATTAARSAAIDRAAVEGQPTPYFDPIPEFNLAEMLLQNTDLSNWIRKFSNDLEVMKSSLKKSQAEEREVLASNQLEQNKSQDIAEWMNKIKVLLWPSSSEDINLGAPSLSGELPEGIRLAAVEADSLGISKVEDVIYVVQCFLWMGWCYRCMHSIRGPICTNELRRLINAARNIKFYDDRIVKILLVILTRANTWKAKARKYFKGTTRHDLSRITPLVLEANSIPLNSRLKIQCQRIYDELSGIPVQPLVGLAISGKRVPKVSAVYAESNPASLVPSQSRLEDSNSTDDEEGAEPDYLQFMAKICLATIPQNLWPPALSFTSKELLITKRPASSEATSSDDDNATKRVRTEDAV